MEKILSRIVIGKVLVDIYLSQFHNDILNLTSPKVSLYDAHHVRKTIAPPPAKKNSYRKETKKPEVEGRKLLIKTAL